MSTADQVQAVATAQVTSPTASVAEERPATLEAFLSPTSRFLSKTKTGGKGFFGNGSSTPTLQPTEIANKVASLMAPRPPFYSNVDNSDLIANLGNASIMNSDALREAAQKNWEKKRQQREAAKKAAEKKHKTTAVTADGPADEATTVAGAALAKAKSLIPHFKSKKTESAEHATEQTAAEVEQASVATDKGTEESAEEEENAVAASGTFQEILSDDDSDFDDSEPYVGTVWGALKSLNIGASFSAIPTVDGNAVAATTEGPEDDGLWTSMMVTCDLNCSNLKLAKSAVIPTHVLDENHYFDGNANSLYTHIGVGKKYKWDSFKTPPANSMASVFAYNPLIGNPTTQAWEWPSWVPFLGGKKDTQDGGAPKPSLPSAGTDSKGQKRVWIPSATDVSVHATWWGFEIALPPPVMKELEGDVEQAEKIANLVSKVLSYIANNTPAGVPLALLPFIAVLKAIAPVSAYAATFIGWSWNEIKSFDQGHGVELSATWLLPIALIPHAWSAPIPPAPTPAPAPTNPAPSAPSVPTKEPVATPAPVPGPEAPSTPAKEPVATPAPSTPAKEPVITPAPATPAKEPVVTPVPAVPEAPVAEPAEPEPEAPVAAEPEQPAPVSEEPVKPEKPTEPVTEPEEPIEPEEPTSEGPAPEEPAPEEPTEPEAPVEAEPEEPTVTQLVADETPSEEAAGEETAAPAVEKKEKKKLNLFNKKA